MFIDVEHHMRFSYDDFVHQSWMELRVEPRSSSTQAVHSFYLAVGPPAGVARYLDWNGNVVHHFGVPDFHDRIEVVARSLVDVHPDAIELSALGEPPGGGVGPLFDFASFGGPVERSTALEGLERELPERADAPIGRQIAAIGATLRERFRYETGVTDSRSTSEHILEQGSGVCQDFAHLMLGLLRLRAIPCRYVSGYLHVDPRRDGEPSQSHAWVEVYCGSAGWVPFDPTHDRVTNEQYVCVARGRHYNDVPPNRGIYRGTASESFETEVHTRPAERRDVAGMHDLIGEIEVPVYHELPDRRGHLAEPAPEEDSQQQQQQ